MAYALLFSRARSEYVNLLLTMQICFMLIFYALQLGFQYFAVPAGGNGANNRSLELARAAYARCKCTASETIGLF